MCHSGNGESEAFRLEDRFPELLVASLSEMLDAEVTAPEGRRSGAVFELDFGFSRPLKHEELAILDEAARRRLKSQNGAPEGPGVFKLQNVSGLEPRAEYPGSFFQRLRGLVAKTQEELDQHLRLIEEAEKRDHRRLGQELELFSMQEAIGPGLVLWHPRGGMLIRVAEEYLRSAHEEEGYEFVYTPHIGKAELWKTSGHLAWYSEAMYPPMELEDAVYYLKPMNCPFHCHIYKHLPRSYRDLPLRYAEWGTVYRYERSGTLQGLMRVRGFTQDDAHIFCLPEQIGEEVDRILRFTLRVLRRFGLNEVQAFLSTRNPEKFVGNAEDWELPTRSLAEALERVGIQYERDEGEAAFYGPKIDIKAKDGLGRWWQLSTIQFDFNLPERFGLTYTGADGKPHHPYMIHRALLGSMERFLGIVIEHFAGAFPLWLAPTQVAILAIGSEGAEYANRVQAKLRERGVRVTVDSREERLGPKVRRATEAKIPLIVVAGPNEVAAGTVSIRDGKSTLTVTVEQLIEKTLLETKER